MRADVVIRRTEQGKFKVFRPDKSLFDIFDDINKALACAKQLLNKEK